MCRLDGADLHFTQALDGGRLVGLVAAFAPSECQRPDE
jgi:hypothetical protein